MGRSAAIACVEAGANVVVVGRDSEAADSICAELGERARSVVGDATDSNTAPRAIAEAYEAFGNLHGLYHVAGGSARSLGDGVLHSATDEGWEFALRQNLTSVFYSNRAIVQAWQERKQSGSVVNMGSVLGFSPSPTYFGTIGYSTAKAAIIGLTRTNAATYARENIRFNVIAPALVETKMAKRAAGNEQIMDFVKTKQPLDGGRISQANDLDEAVLFLLSDASKLVTGQVLTVDGGWSISEGQFCS
jgi:NAD(P)-dependent dehydrogenase (short-subunit alcohol dehydrogenase family)